jgi:signal transduction histidine kinase
MTLTTRLSVFFLAALALVLVGFSITLYWLAGIYLYRQVDDRLQTALETLAAATEIGSDGLVEWEGIDRVPSLGRDGNPVSVRWLVTTGDADAVQVARSPNLGAADLLRRCSLSFVLDRAVRREVEEQGHVWRLVHRRVEAPGAGSALVAQPAENKFPDLELTVGSSLEPAQTTLRNLALWLGVLSGTVWLLAAFVGRALCRRALVPVRRMADTARAMGVADLYQRLPTPDTHDELEELGRAFNDLLDRRHESFERQRCFTGDASHQLRTPLAAMLGQVEVVLRRERPPEEYRKVLELVQAQAGRLRHIIDMLLFLARADAEAKLPLLETIELGAWLTAHLHAWAEHARSDDLRFTAADAEPLWVQAQAPLLGQLVDNLLDNACKYSCPGTPITLRLEHEADQVRLIIEDAGRGIPAEDVPYIFEPFYRSPEARRLGVGGVGLGLTVAQRIALAFGGSLQVQSQPAAGTRFILQLPRMHVDLSQAPALGEAS